MFVNVCVVGAGAVGGIIAVRLALSGENVCVVERGAQFAAIRSKGLEVRGQDGQIYRARVQAFERVSEAEEQDLFVLAVSGCLKQRHHVSFSDYCGTGQ